jgi:hypothetical protein
MKTYTAASRMNSGTIWMRMISLTLQLLYIRYLWKTDTEAAENKSNLAMFRMCPIPQPTDLSELSQYTKKNIMNVKILYRGHAIS